MPHRLMEPDSLDGSIRLLPPVPKQAPETVELAFQLGYVQEQVESCNQFIQSGLEWMQRALDELGGRTAFLEVRTQQLSDQRSQKDKDATVASNMCTPLDLERDGLLKNDVNALQAKVEAMESHSSEMMKVVEQNRFSLRDQVQQVELLCKETLTEIKDIVSGQVQCPDQAQPMVDTPSKVRMRIQEIINSMDATHSEADTDLPELSTEVGTDSSSASQCSGGERDATVEALQSMLVGCLRSEFQEHITQVLHDVMQSKAQQTVSCAATSQPDGLARCNLSPRVAGSMTRLTSMTSSIKGPTPMQVAPRVKQASHSVWSGGSKALNPSLVRRQSSPPPAAKVSAVPPYSAVCMKNISHMPPFVRRQSSAPPTPRNSCPGSLWLASRAAAA